MDTAKYGNELMQLMCMYTEQKLTLTATGGYMNQFGTVNDSAATIPSNMKFFGITGNYQLNKMVSITGGQDFGLAPFGFCKYSMNGGFVCNFKKKPVTLRMNFRYSTYQLDAGQSWKQLYNVTLDLSYRFKSKLEKKNNF